MMRYLIVLAAVALGATDTVGAQELTPNEVIHGRRVRIGVGISCSNCTLGWPMFEFASPPTVDTVLARSIGERAGLKKGDRILEIDGLSVTTQAGGPLFGAQVPGRSQKWVVEREGKRVELTLVVPADA
jgi:C-terminal processing protease CtpA/Prc